MSVLVLRRLFSLNFLKYRNFKHPYGKIWAHNIVAKLNAEEIEMLKLEIDKLNISKESDNAAVSYHDLKIANGLPFVGFGLLDNGIMILAGEYIDIKLGAFFGISTMAAAGLGNLISDMVGIGTVGYVETLALKAGVRIPPLSTIQRQYRSVKFSATLGRLLGITIGCLLGMLPLLMFDYTGHGACQECLARKEN